MSHRWTSSNNNHVGLLPIRIIFNTTSLASKMYNWDSPWGRMCVHRNLIHTRQINVFGRHSFGFGCALWFCSGFPWAGGQPRLHYLVSNAIPQTKSHKSRAGKPSIRKPASKDTISDSLELCDTEVCFFTHPAHRVQTCDFRIFKTFRLKSISNLQGLQQSQSLESTLIDNVVLYFHMTKLTVVSCVM